MWASSDAIAKYKQKFDYKLKDFEKFNNNTYIINFYLSFRHCQKGEIYLQEYQTYSFKILNI